MPGGADRDVTNENRAEYVALATKALLRAYEEKLREQTAALRLGMARACGSETTLQRLCALVGARDFNTLVGGRPSINVADWKAHTQVEGVGDATCDVVKWFWDIVEGTFTNEERSGLLRFATGASNVPAGGFANLSGYGGQDHAFRLQLLAYDPERRTVTASACFNTIRVPVFPTRAELEERLREAVQAAGEEFFEGDAADE